jgi:bifunctional DNA-binding transcriptional regulator/antitoxin component of YhaV-PrlF toxin-antitoxin module
MMEDLVEVEIRRVDPQGRLVLPADWRESEVGSGGEVYIVKRKRYLKIIPKIKVDLTENFDKIDLGLESIGKWRDFERKLYEGAR